MIITKKTSSTAPMMPRRHQRAGLISILFVLFIVITGALLNHTEALRLDSRYVRVDALLDWYNIRPPQPPLGVELDRHWVTQVGRQVYFDEQLLVNVSTPLIGAADLGDLIILAAPDRLILLTQDGALVETLDGVDGIPADISLVGKTRGGRVALRSAEQVYIVDLDALRVEPAEHGAAIEWSRMSPPPPAVAAVLEEQYRGHGLPLERVLLDMHSGRILGGLGVALVDISALVLVFLAVSGLWLWVRPRYRTLKKARRTIRGSSEIQTTAERVHE